MDDNEIGKILVSENDDGKAVWEFEGLVTSDVPLDTESQDFANAINELVGKLQNEGGGDDIYIVNGAGTSIAVSVISDRSSGNYVTYSFICNTKAYKTVTVLSSKKTKVEKVWTKTVITGVLCDGEMIWKFGLNDKGNITAVYDRVGNEILKGTTGAAGQSVLTSTPEGIALGWALAYNNEQSRIMQEKIDSYKDGIDDYKEAVGIKDGENSGNDGGDGYGDGSGDGSGNNGGDGSGSGGGDGLITIDPSVTVEEVDLRGYGALVVFDTERYTDYCYSNYVVIDRSRINSSGQFSYTRYGNLAVCRDWSKWDGSSVEWYYSSYASSTEWGDSRYKFYGDIRYPDGSPYPTDKI